MSGQNRDDSEKSGGVPSAAALALDGLVDVAPGSIVSRTLCDKKSGTLTMFAFDADQGLSEHSAPFDAHVVVVEGTLELTIGGEEVVARHGDLVVMPADVPHALRAVEPTKMLLTMIR
jgi:quercetin dioxygenase-like cupin family protein